MTILPRSGADVPSSGTAAPLSALLIALALAACSNSTSPTGATGRLRVVNSIFQGPDVPSAVPVAVDVLIDSSTSGAALSALAAANVSQGNASGEGAGTHPGASALFTAAGYRDLPSGIHSFVARVSGTTGPTSSFFRTTDGTSDYLPKQFITPFPYSFVLAGVVPPAGTPAGPTAVPFTMLVDDPFTPPADPTGGLTARVQVINAAPMSDTTGAGQGTSVAATFDNGAGGVFTAAASYRRSSGYVNPPAGSYTLTLTTGSFLLWTGTVTLTKGEVRTFVVQSTAYAAVPGPGNTTVTNLLDNQW